MKKAFGIIVGCLIAANGWTAEPTGEQIKIDSEGALGAAEAQIRNSVCRPEAAGGRPVGAADPLETLRRNGLSQGREILLTKQDAQDTKQARRLCVESGTGRCRAYGPMPILALVGDSLRDFVELYGDQAVRQRALVGKAPDWGTRFFVLPNPMYGQWERGYQGAKEKLK